MTGETLSQSPSLFEQTKGRVALGNEKSDVCSTIGYIVKGAGFNRPSREQVQTVLESVTEVFPEDWKCPRVRSLARYAERYLNTEQQRVFQRLQTLGRPLTGRALERVIKAGLDFRECSRPK